MVEHIKYTYQLGLYSDIAWLRRTTNIRRIACLLAISERCVGGMKIIELNLVCEKVTKVAKLQFARIQSITQETSIISSKGNEVLHKESGIL
jgi:hypothetical protein